jgi:hypothetical protein
MDERKEGYYWVRKGDEELPLYWDAFLKQWYISRNISTVSVNKDDMFVDIKNWNGNLNNTIYFSEWIETVFGYERKFHFRREAKSLFKILIYKRGEKYQVGFKQEDGRGLASEERYDNVETAKIKAMQFFNEEFFVKSLMAQIKTM